MHEQDLYGLKRKPGIRPGMAVYGDRIPLLTFPELDKADFIRHGCSTRLGGVSEGFCSTLNLSFSRGDREEAVRENFHRLAEALQVSEEQFVFTDQTHTTHVRVVTQEDAGKGLTRPRDYSDTDGLVTNVPGLVLSVFVADCVPVFLADPVHRAIGLVHSGWRGTAGRISREALHLMEQNYGTDPADVLCGIAPSICQDCYEISRDVAEVFGKEFRGHESEILTSPQQKERETVAAVLAEGTPEDKFHLDLWKANRIVLEEAGVLPEHISVTDVCTCCNPNLLFSHRASHGKRGNIGAFLMLLPEIV